VRFVLSQEANVLLVPNAALRWTPSALAQIAPDARPGISDDASGEPVKKANPPQPSRRILWLKDGAFVRPIEVTAATSDGASTAVAAEGLREGQEVVTGETTASAQTDVKNPFLPKAYRR